LFTFFLPAAGHRLSDDPGGEIASQGSGGWYWSSTQFSSQIGHLLRFSGSLSEIANNTGKMLGRSIRCVRYEIRFMEFSCQLLVTVAIS